MQHSSTFAAKESTNMTDSNCRDQLTQYFDLTCSTSNENSDIKFLKIELDIINEEKFINYLKANI